MFLLLFVSVAYAGCGELQDYKKCSGTPYMIDLENYGRSQGGKEATKGTGNSAKEFCKKQCEHFGRPGCCGIDKTNGWKCTFIVDGSAADNQETYKVTNGWKNSYPAKFMASQCTFPNCELEMQLINGQFLHQCDWDRVDKPGRLSKNGGGNSVASCDNWCLNTPSCAFVTRSSDGVCHSTTTCRIQTNWGSPGWTKKQKVCKGAPNYREVEDWKRDFNPLGNECPMGYFSGLGFPVVHTDCSGNKGGWCIKSEKDALAFCQTKECSLVTRTSNTKWRAAHGSDAVVVVVNGGSTALQPNHEWKSCMKETSSDALVMVKEASQHHLAIQALALVGFVFTTYGAVRHYVK